MVDINALSDRLKAWFTSQMIAPDDRLLQRLEKLVAQYDEGAQNNMTVGEMDEIFSKSDKIQAELWRRHVERTIYQ